MSKILDAEYSVTMLKLEQKGGKVKLIKSKTCYVEFMVENLKLSYVYNITKNGKYYLERVEPYPLVVKEFDKEAVVVDLILFDVEQFKNAAKSHNIHEFVDVASEINSTIKLFEYMFLYHNVPKGNLSLIHEKLDEIRKLIAETIEYSDKVYERGDSPIIKYMSKDSTNNSKIGVYDECF